LPTSSLVARRPLADDVVRRLACPSCHAALRVDGAAVRCTDDGCHFDGLIVDDVVVVGDRSAVSFFDARHQIMEQGKACDGAWCLCYELQAKLAESALRPGTVVLDVGCGPSLPYARPDACFVIGLEASYESIRVNDAVDLRVYGTASALPLPTRSVDTILCFYSLHHMTGRTVDENREIALGVFRELGRVVKPGGELLVFEVSPWGPAWSVERSLWNWAKKAIGPRLDMFFYPNQELEELGRRALPDATFSRQVFERSKLSTFPPAFSLPWLHVPRFLYPFDVSLYRWRF
jgi:SAM-dependent methyltransferase